MNNHKNVTLFVQCLIDAMYPHVAEKIVRVFEKTGVSVDCPRDQTCCGQPAFNAGYRKEAVVAAKRFIEIFETSEAIVCPSGSCVYMVRRHYPELFENDPKWRRRAKDVAAKTFEFTEYLVDILHHVAFGATFDGKVTYHDSCHLNYGLGIRTQPRKLIAGVGKAEFVEMPDSDRCCGFGGTFSVKFPDISAAVLEEKVETIVAAGADAVIGADMSCLMNIQGLLNRKNIPIKTLHIAEFIAGESS